MSSSAVWNEVQMHARLQRAMVREVLRVKTDVTLRVMFPLSQARDLLFHSPFMPAAKAMRKQIDHELDAWQAKPEAERGPEPFTFFPIDVKGKPS